MAQRPPRMPRRPQPESTPPEHNPPAQAPAVPRAKVVRLPDETHDSPAAELPTDALNVVPPARQRPEAQAKPATAKPKPKPKARTATQPKPPLRERARQKQSERRMDDRVKFSAAVRRKPGEPVEQTPQVAGEPVAAHRFSGRVAALLVVLAFFAVMLVPTVNHYRNQMHEISELRENITAMEAERDRLKDEIARWDDPLYIKQQARERINLVMPGERVYMVVGEEPAAQTEEQNANGSTYEVRQELPWVDALIDSVRRAATD